MYEKEDKRITTYTHGEYPHNIDSSNTLYNTSYIY